MAATDPAHQRDPTPPRRPNQPTQAGGGMTTQRQSRPSTASSERPMAAIGQGRPG
jgi:hypothetical protein